MARYLVIGGGITGLSAALDLADSGNDVTSEFLSWLRPLVGPLPPKGLLNSQRIEVR